MLFSIQSSKSYTTGSSYAMKPANSWFRDHLFGLFLDDTSSQTTYRPMVRSWMNWLRRVSKEAVMSWSRFYRGIYLEGLSKTTKHFRPVRDSNRAPPENESTTLPLRQPDPWRLQKSKSPQLVKEFSRIHGSSLPCSQEPSISPQLEPDESDPHSSVCYFFNITIPHIPRFTKWSLSVTFS